MHYLRLAAILSLAVACSKSAKTPAAEESPAAPTAVEAATARPDDVARLQLADQAAPVFEDRGTVELKANATFRDAQAVYVRAQASELFAAELVRFTVQGTPYGLAATGADSTEQIVVRFPGKSAPEAFDVAWESVTQTSEPAGKGTLHIVVPKNVKSVKTLPTDFFAALGWTFQTTALSVPGADSFYTFAAERARLVSRPMRRGSEDQFVNDIDEAMAMYTGAASLRDALQTQRALRIRRPGKRTVAIADVEALPVTAHPWERLNRELGLKPTVEPLAGVVPAGMLYLHASSAKSLHATVNTLSERLLGLVQASGIDGGDGDIIKRYADQLALESSPAMSVLADTAIDGIALASSDPFFREGTDVTVVFHVTNAPLLKTGLAKKVDDLKSRFTTTTTTYKLGAHEVSLTASADGAVNRHQLELGDTVLVSNSKAALERFVAVRDSGAPSIAAGGDFSYLRALYPYDRGAEDAFAFVGDAFVQHVTSPAFKIASARRVQAAADVRAVSYAAMLYAWLEGHAPQSTDALLKAKLLEKSDLVHEGGEPITFDRITGARSKSASGFAKPILETVIDKVTPEEREAYASFRSEYEMVWSRFVDPAALRITTRGKSLTLDARMLPVTSRGDYADIESLAGPARVAAPPARDGITWVSAVGPDAALRRDLEGTGKGFMGSDFSLGWLGTWVTVGAMDRAGLWDLVVASGTLGEPRRDEEADESGFIPPLWRTALQRAPIFVGADVKNPVALAALLTGARRAVEQAAPGLVEWATEEPIDGQPVSVIREMSEVAPEQRIAIRYSTINGVFMASLSRETLEKQFASIKAGRGPKAAPSETKQTPSTKSLEVSAQSAIDYAPADNGWIAKIATALLERSQKLGVLRAAAAERAIAPYLNGVTDEAERARITTAMLGYSAHAPDVSPSASIARLRGVSARVAVDGQNDHRGLHAAVTLSE